LDSVKKLFVEKLRVLESNFAEIGDHLIANQATASASAAAAQA
jgi:chromosome segregation ATPase